MNTTLVRGILPVHQMVAIEAHSFVCGFASMGGREFPVIDLRAKLNIPHGSHGREPFIIAVETDGRIAGFIADRVSDIVELRARDFRNGVLRVVGRARRVLEAGEIMTEEDWAAFGLFVR
jgi:chemotaxis signal transduction protein